ncbi:hypothetical protein [Endozoicomonas sp. SESOKO4]|uniref:hypothetical protein n=1 Tax=Endozoicomonas sp. SESOKO4 TaxID=2828745 RepID=UPI00214937E2|nr:hypothetical protein [Endozoicomonas sp. SESOKO4]
MIRDDTTTSWQDQTADPVFQQADDAEKERLRNQYWEQNLAPAIPMENWAEAKKHF